MDGRQTTGNQKSSQELSAQVRLNVLNHLIKSARILQEHDNITYENH